MVDETLREYIERLEKALSSGKSIKTFNKDFYHAFEIILAVLRHARREILMLSNKLDSTLYGSPPVIDAVREFVQAKGGSLRILVETDIDESHPMLKLAAECGSNISIARVPAEKQDYPYNFLIMDGSGYRFEANRASTSAIAAFHNPEAEKMAAQLHRKFETLAAVSPM